MAEILPFRALQFASDRVPLAKVVTQPYDKISPAMERRYLDAHPNNIVRIIRPGSASGFEDGASPYENADRLLDQWRREGIIRQVGEPCLFAYFQRFHVPGTDEVRIRKGVTCLTRLEDYVNRVIFPHERTLSGPKQDRLELLRRTRTHFGQVFLLYSDPGGRVDAVLDGVASGPPEVSILDEYDVEHMLWAVKDARAIGEVSIEMADRKLVIADGHHRYETALAFRDERRRESGSSGAGGHDWLMTTLVNMDSSGMTILPTHRVLSNFERFDSAELISAAKEYFQVRRLDTSDALESMLKTSGLHRPSIGMAAGPSPEYFLFELGEGVRPEALLDGVSPERARLDVVILHQLILGRCLGISEDAVRGENHLRYVRDFADAVRVVADRRAQAAFLLNPTRLEQVRDIAFSGETLPQKSTDFFPKLLTGLMMYAID